MKSVIIKNSTDKALIVEYSNQQYTVGLNEKLNVELTQSDKIRIYPRFAKSTHFAAGQFFMKGTLRNAWLFMLAYIVSLDSVFTMPRGVRLLDITSRDYHHSTFIVFRLLLLNGKAPDKCEFRKSADRKIVMLLNCITILPICIFCFGILLLSVYGLIVEFAPEFIVSALLSLVGACVTVSMLKSARRFANISDNTEQVLAENKKIVILKESDRYLKYREYIE